MIIKNQINQLEVVKDFQKDREIKLETIFLKSFNKKNKMIINLLKCQYKKQDKNNKNLRVKLQTNINFNILKSNIRKEHQCNKF
jgi:hypothetical protein